MNNEVVICCDKCGATLSESAPEASQEPVDNCRFCGCTDTIIIPSDEVERWEPTHRITIHHGSDKCEILVMLDRECVYTKDEWNGMQEARWPEHPEPRLHRESRYQRMRNINPQAIYRPTYAGAVYTKPTLIYNRRDGFAWVRMPDDASEVEQRLANDWHTKNPTAIGAEREAIKAGLRPEQVYYTEE